MKTSIWAEWFKQNGMHYAEERERMSDQPQVGKIEQLSDKPISKELKNALDMIERLPPMSLRAINAIVEENEQIKSERGIAEALDIYEQEIRRLKKLFGEIDDAAYMLDCMLATRGALVESDYPQIKFIRNKCGEALKEKG